MMDMIGETHHQGENQHANETFGETIFYHPIMEAKLVTSNGFAFSMLTEFTPRLRWVQVLKTPT